MGSPSPWWQVSKVVRAVHGPGLQMVEEDGEGCRCYTSPHLSPVTLTCHLSPREGRIVEGDATFCSLVLGHPPGGLEGTRIEQVRGAQSPPHITLNYSPLNILSSHP